LPPTRDFGESLDLESLDRLSGVDQAEGAVERINQNQLQKEKENLSYWLSNGVGEALAFD